MELQPDSSIEDRPKTAALYFKFPTFINKEQLYDHIKRHGFGNNVVAIDMHNRKCTKLPAGSAKVSIVPPAIVEVFIEALHGTCLPGEFEQLLSVQRYMQKEDQSHKVFVGPGLPHTVTQQDIQMHFKKMKDEFTDLEIKREKRRNTCYVLLTFKSANTARQAVDIYHQTTLFEKRIKVEMYQPEKTQQKSIPKYTQKRENSKVLTSSTMVIAENLDPELSKPDLESLTNVRIVSYTPSHMTPDRTAAWIEVSNFMDAHTIADCLNERIVAGRKIHCSMMKSTALRKLMTCKETDTQVELPCSTSEDLTLKHHQLSVVAQDHVSPYLHTMESDMTQTERIHHQHLVTLPQCSILKLPVKDE